ncbi:hypothetical protein K488DRAFT_84888 [Vararia minispora EC-137]|uniref:Uncharacterized protein n=1 Tax=Vararia minispora EC-137 TaxID=1314806 RepID=A0ACB8QNL4_9AGAM|nr:hypothetical protein K488DRAFT_84888 [Vararia minispora EC-137]
MATTKYAFSTTTTSAPYPVARPTTTRAHPLHSNSASLPSIAAAEKTVDEESSDDSSSSDEDSDAAWNDFETAVHSTPETGKTSLAECEDDESVYAAEEGLGEVGLFTFCVSLKEKSKQCAVELLPVMSEDRDHLQVEVQCDTLIAILSVPSRRRQIWELDFECELASIAEHDGTEAYSIESGWLEVFDEGRIAALLLPRPPVSAKTFVALAASTKRKASDEPPSSFATKRVRTSAEPAAQTAGSSLPKSTISPSLISAVVSPPRPIVNPIPKAKTQDKSTKASAAVLNHPLPIFPVDTHWHPFLALPDPHLAPSPPKPIAPSPPKIAAPLPFKPAVPSPLNPAALSLSRPAVPQPLKPVSLAATRTYLSPLCLPVPVPAASRSAPVVTQGARALSTSSALWAPLSSSVASPAIQAGVKRKAGEESEAATPPSQAKKPKWWLQPGALEPPRKTVERPAAQVETREVTSSSASPKPTPLLTRAYQRLDDVQRAIIAVLPTDATKALTAKEIKALLPASFEGTLSGSSIGKVGINARKGLSGAARWVLNERWLPFSPHAHGAPSWQPIIPGSINPLAFLPPTHSPDPVLAQSGVTKQR